MMAIETIATAEDESHLVLEKPLARMPNGPVKIIVMLEDEDPTPKRILGHMEGRASCRIGADFVISDDELLSPPRPFRSSARVASNSIRMGASVAGSSDERL